MNLYLTEVGSGPLKSASELIFYLKIKDADIHVDVKHADVQ